MKTLIQGAQIIDSSSLWHLQEVNLEIEGGSISKIVSSNEVIASTEEDIVIPAQGKKLSPGWIDMRAWVPEPGLEHLEDLESAQKAAMKGGFTEVVLLPNSQPPRQHKSDLAFIHGVNQNSLCHFHPMACVTMQAEGKDLTEMMDLFDSGAVAFGDGQEVIWNSGIMMKALQYVQFMDALLINRPADPVLSAQGQMNEGLVSTHLGLKGLPKLAEELMVQRDIQFLEYTGGKLHLSLISSARSLEMIRAAKQKGLALTCDVAVHQLLFDENALWGFDTNLKVNPPFRESSDVDALWEALADGTIDVIVSDHCPRDEEGKNLEFHQAEFGIVSLETFFPSLLTEWKKRSPKEIDLSSLIEKFSRQVRKILKLPEVRMEEGALANLTLFDEQREWEYRASEAYSKSVNSPFLGQKLTGKVEGVFRNGQQQIWS